MKIQKQWFFYIAGLISMAFAYYGHVSNNECESEAVWPTYVYLLGALIFGIGLYSFFAKTTKSPVKASIFSLLLVVVILIAGIILAVSSQSDGVFHCYEF
jgi:di/tricarboxylate transporter